MSSAAHAIASQPRTEHAALDESAVPTGCPYDFGSEMPAATFCVYRGVARDAEGAVCARNVMLIWSSFTGSTRPDAARGASKARELYVGLVADPELVLRGTVAPQAPDTAQLTGVGDTQSAEPIGQLHLRGVAEKSDVVNVKLRSVDASRDDDCALASYSGTFIGILHPSAE